MILKYGVPLTAGTLLFAHFTDGQRPSDAEILFSRGLLQYDEANYSNRLCGTDVMIRCVYTYTYTVEYTAEECA